MAIHNLVPGRDLHVSGVTGTNGQAATCMSAV
mgnify:CR=1 FL=1